MPSLRAFTRAMSTRIAPASKPNSAPRRAWRMARALATRVLVGTQPTLTQVPPKWWRSITAVRSPSLAAARGDGGPGLAGADDDGIEGLRLHGSDLRCGAFARTRGP